MADGETVFYEGPGVTITTTRAVFFGTTYPMANVTSVRLREEPRPFLFALAGACGALLGFLTHKPFPDFGLVCFVVGLVCVAIYAAHSVKFWVCIGAAGGETSACSFKKREDAQAVIDSMNEAIVRRE